MFPLLLYNNDYQLLQNIVGFIEQMADIISELGLFEYSFGKAKIAGEQKYGT